MTRAGMLSLLWEDGWYSITCYSPPNEHESSLPNENETLVNMFSSEFIGCRLYDTSNKLATGSSGAREQLWCGRVRPFHGKSDSSSVLQAVTRSAVKRAIAHENPDFADSAVSGERVERIVPGVLPEDLSKGSLSKESPGLVSP